MTVIFNFNVWINKYHYFVLSLSSRGKRLHLRPQPNNSCANWKLCRESRKTIQSTGHRAEMNLRSHHHSANAVSIQLVKHSLSKYPMQNLNPSVHEIASIWCQFQLLCTLYSRWKTNLHSQWAQGTRNMSQTPTVHGWKSHLHCIIHGAASAIAPVPPPAKNDFCLSRRLTTKEGIRIWLGRMLESEFSVMAVQLSIVGTCN